MFVILASLRYSIKTLSPSEEEFQDFEKYIKKIESEGASRGGIVKVRPDFILLKSQIIIDLK